MQLVAKHPEQRRVVRKVDGVSLAVDEQQGHVGSESAHSKYANVAARGRAKMGVANAEREP
jgi:hypothetical protein